eukprot:COSAG06_NODE_1871_length_8166_cov_129.883228_8_plen_110_part_00
MRSAWIWSQDADCKTVGDMVQAAKGLETILMKYNVDIWNAGANENNSRFSLSPFRSKPPFAKTGSGQLTRKENLLKKDDDAVFSVLRFPGHVHDYQVRKRGCKAIYIYK